MKKITMISLAIIIFFNIIALVSAIMIYINFKNDNINETISNETISNETISNETISNDDLKKLKEIFNEIKEIHKIKYDNKILGYNWYIRNDKEYYEIIHDYEPNNGSSISIYTTIYIKTDTGNIYEISNERN